MLRLLARPRPLRPLALLFALPVLVAAQTTRSGTAAAGAASTGQSPVADPALSPPGSFTGSLDERDDDGDGLTYAEEMRRGSDPAKPDTDGDGVLDALDGWPREPSITQAPLAPTAYVHVPLSAFGLPIPATGNSTLVTRRLTNDWRVLTEEYLGSGAIDYNIRLHNLLTGTSELLYARLRGSYYFGLSQIDNAAFATKYATWLNGSPLEEGFLDLLSSDAISQLAFSRYKIVARNGGSALCQWDGQAIRTSYHAPGGATRLLPLNPVGLPSGGDVAFQTSLPLLVNDAGDVVTLEQGYYGKKQYSSDTYYRTRSKYLAVYLNHADGRAEKLGPGIGMEITSPATPATGSAFLPLVLTEDAKMLGYLLNANQSLSAIGYLPTWWNGQFQSGSAVAPFNSSAAYLYSAALAASASNASLGISTRKNDSVWVIDRPGGTLEWKRAEFWSPQKQIVTSLTFPRAMNSRLELVGSGPASSLSSLPGFGEGVVRNGIYQPISSASGSLALTDINDHGVILDARYLTIPATLHVDANRNGVLDDADVNAPPAANPFWLAVNDSDDAPGAEPEPDCDNATVDGADDLSDFTPVFLDLRQLLTLLPRSDAVRYKLKQADGAFNFTYTSLNRATAFAYLNAASATTGYGPNADQAAAGATTEQITAAGAELGSTFLDRIRDQGQGVILIEARKISAAPLRLVVEKSGTEIAELALNIASLRLYADPGKVHLGFDPPNKSEPEDRAAPSTYWASVVQGSTNTILNLDLPASALAGLEWKIATSDASRVNISPKTFTGATTKLTITGLSSSLDAPYEATITLVPSGSTGPAILTLKVLIFRQRPPIKIGFYVIEDNSSPGTKFASAPNLDKPSPASAIATLNSIFSHMGVTFENDAELSTSTADEPYDTHTLVRDSNGVPLYDPATDQGLGQTQLGQDGLFSSIELESQFINDPKYTSSRINIMILKKSGRPYLPGYPSLMKRGVSFGENKILLFAQDCYGFLDLAISHEVGHTLGLSTVDEVTAGEDDGGGDHDNPPYPKQVIDDILFSNPSPPDTGLPYTEKPNAAIMQSGWPRGGSLPWLRGKWMRHEDWRKANESANTLAQ